MINLQRIDPDAILKASWREEYRAQKETIGHDVSHSTPIEGGSGLRLLDTKAAYNSLLEPTAPPPRLKREPLGPQCGSVVLCSRSGGVTWHRRSMNWKPRR